MLEMLVGGGGKPYYPKSGPGPKSLQYGNEQAGYFGTVTQSQLFTPTEIFNQLNIPLLGPSLDASMLWGKFYYQGTIVYIPTRPVNTTAQVFSWESLYQMGLVYGTDSDGAYPSPVSAPYNQRTLIVKKLENKVAGFKVRLPSAGNTDPMTATLSAAGEFSVLLSNIIALGVGAGTGKWDSLDTTVFNSTSYELSLTSLLNSTTSALYGRGLTNNPGQYSYSNLSKTGTSTAALWWPVLQYINPDENLLDLINFTTQLPQPMAVDMLQTTGESTGGILNAFNVTSSPVAKPAQASATYTAVVSPVNLYPSVAGPAPRVTKVTAEPLQGPVNIVVSHVGPTPVLKVDNPMTVFNPFAPTVRYEPKPLTGLKLADQ
jgi:hypothetical protein